MKKLITLFSMVWMMAMISSTIANNITVANVSLEGQVVADHYCLVEFDLSWDNSWRTTAIPQNWDAAWVFVKFSVAGGPWHHAYLNATGAVAPTGSTIDIPANTNGAFIYRDADGNGTFSLTNVQLRWDYGEDGVYDDASVEVKVFAIEMVYVPQGSFYLGDGSGDYDGFRKGTNPNYTYLVTNTPINVCWLLTCLNSDNNSLPDQTTVPDAYPIGYNAFYCMKYEMSQEQYVDFLNTLNRTQQNTRTVVDVSGDVVTNYFVMADNTNLGNRNGIRCDASDLGTTNPIVFYCDMNENGIGGEPGDGQNIACNYLSWMDMAAYADWAGLRPMTECEFEKAARGPNTPVAHEYVWGNTSLHSSAYTIIHADSANESITDLGVNVGNMLYADTYGSNSGPTRCGIFAASSTNHTRTETGASYFGIMNLGGNLFEMTVFLLDPAGLSFTGLHGDGELIGTGNANTDYWPGINGNSNHNTPNAVYSTAGVTHAAGAIIRGGYWSAGDAFAQISDRQHYDFSYLWLTSNMNISGGRLVHTAP